MPTRKITSKLRKTSKKSSHSHKYSESEITKTFLEMLNIIKVYHWKTFSYSTHKATDELYHDLNGRVDEFIETMLGKTGNRINLSSCHSIPFTNYSNLSKFKSKIESFKSYLIHMSHYSILQNNTDLSNIRDEILGDLNKFTYLLTFK